MAILQRLFLLFCVRLIGVTHTPNYINISPAFLIFLLSFSKQSWHVSFSWVWMTLTRFVWRIQTRYWSRAPHCSTCGPLARARGQRVSKSEFAVDICHFTSLKATLLWFLETHPSSSFFHACLWLLFFHCSGEFVHSSEEHRPHGHHKHVGGPATSACETRIPWSQQTSTQRERPSVPWYDQW